MSIFTRAIWNQRGDGTTVMFTTLNMLLLAFFIVLNSLSVVDEEKKIIALGSLLGSLGIMQKGLSPGENTGKMIASPGPEISEEDVKAVRLLENLEKFSREHDIGGDISVQKSEMGVKILMTSEIVFKPGMATLSPRSRDLLKRVAAVLAEMEGDITVEGHSSEGSFAKGPYPDDWTLSWARAGTAARVLIKDGDFNPKRLSIAGYAFYKPLLGGGTGLREHFNDRLEISLEKRRI